MIIRFAEFQCGLVESGLKRITLRRPRADGRPEVGERLTLMGPRSNPRLLRRAVCRRVAPVVVDLREGPAVARVAVDGAFVADVEAFARLDGFDGPAHMRDFFVGLYGAVLWHGVMIEW